jgi:hypothetical protein
MDVAEMTTAINVDTPAMVRSRGGRDEPEPEPCLLLVKSPNIVGGDAEADGEMEDMGLKSPTARKLRSRDDE